LPVLVDGERGGWAWRVRFLRNPGTYGGATFPPSSGDVHGIVASNPSGILTGTGVTVETVVVNDGSRHLDGGASTLTFTQEGFGSATTGEDEMTFNVDATSVEAALEALPNLGAATVTKELVTGKKVPGVKAYFPRDASSAFWLATLTSPGGSRQARSCGSAARVKAKAWLALTANACSEATTAATAATATRALSCLARLWSIPKLTTPDCRMRRRQVLLRQAVPCVCLELPTR